MTPEFKADSDPSVSRQFGTVADEVRRLSASPDVMLRLATASVGPDRGVGLARPTGCWNRFASHHQAHLVREDDRLDPITQIELVEDVRDVS